MFLLVSEDSLAGLLSIQKRSTGGLWSEDILDFGLLCVSILLVFNSFLLLLSFLGIGKKTGGTVLPSTAEF